MAFDIPSILQRKSKFDKDDFIFFWGHTAKGNEVTKACLSQWFTCSFIVDGQVYNCAEQYMMAEKARIFGDEEVRQQILLESDQMTIKKLGRKVANYDDAIWADMRCAVVVNGNLAKFAQNQELLDFLLKTGDKILVEASPIDRIWGIGLDESSPDACNPRVWRGNNLLGFALMTVREHLQSCV